MSICLSHLKSGDGLETSGQMAQEACICNATIIHKGGQSHKCSLRAAETFLPKTSTHLFSRYSCDHDCAASGTVEIAVDVPACLSANVTAVSDFLSYPFD